MMDKPEEFKVNSRNLDLNLDFGFSITANEGKICVPGVASSAASTTGGACRGECRCAAFILRTFASISTSSQIPKMHRPTETRLPRICLN